MEKDMAILNPELRDAPDIAENSNLSRSRFMGTMSHEIRTPMNGVLSESMARLGIEPDLVADGVAAVDLICVQKCCYDLILFRVARRPMNQAQYFFSLSHEQRGHYD